jgi:hypothetical protein
VGAIVAAILHISLARLTQERAAMELALKFILDLSN